MAKHRTGKVGSQAGCGRHRGTSKTGGCALTMVAAIIAPLTALLVITRDISSIVG